MKLLIALLIFTSAAASADYSFEYTNQRPWEGNKGDGTISSKEVTVFAYVPGSNVQTTRQMTKYTRSFAAKKNIFGDKVGYTYQDYGTRYKAWAKPVGEPKVSVTYATPAGIGSTLINVNDLRLAIGTHTPTGGNRIGFIYDLVSGAIITVKPDWYSAELMDQNDQGQVVGYEIRPSDRRGFVFSCEGYEEIMVPGSDWTIPYRIGNDGTVYGTVAGIDGFKYFIATPSEPFAPSCALVNAVPNPEPTPEPEPEDEGVCPPGETAKYEDDGRLKCED